MYKEFFKLSRNPFDLTPDPTCFVSNRGHNEALASLYYGVRWHKGFVVVTGEVGTGKTLLVRCLLRLLQESKDVCYAYVFNSGLSPTEFLQYIATDFGLPVACKNKCEILTELGHFLVERGNKKLTTLLIVDEAHHLSEEVLEEVRLLSNLETTQDKLLQIVLLGQPELDEKLDSPGLRQLKQRIALRAHLTALEPSETREYIQKRLRIAGADPAKNPVISEAAMSAVHRHSGGLPRLINSLCENAFLSAYAAETHMVTEDLVENAAREFRLQTVSSTVSNQSKSLSPRSLMAEVFAELSDPEPEQIEPTLLGTEIQ